MGNNRIRRFNENSNSKKTIGQISDEIEELEDIKNRYEKKGDSERVAKTQDKIDALKKEFGDKSSNSNKIRLEKLDPTGKVIENIELEGRWKITTGEKSYFMTNRYVDEIKVDTEKIQKNFMDNL